MRILWLIPILFLVACEKGPDPLYIYSSIPSRETADFVKLYQEKTKEKLEYVRLSTGEALARIRSESKNPQVAVWIGGGSNEHVIAGMEGLLEPYQPKTDFVLKRDQHGKSNEWNGWYMGVLGFGTNINFLKKNQLEAPVSYAELMKPIFKRQVGTAYAYTSGTAYTFLASIIELMGHSKGFDFFRQLNKQVHHYNKSGSACVTQVGLGEIAVCIAFSHDIMQKGLDKGYPVKISFPQEGAGYEVGAVSLVKGGPNHEKGKKFIDWLYSLEAQNRLSKWHHIPLHPKAVKSEQAKLALKAKLIPVDIYESGEKHKQLLATWREVTAK
jgi:iron(III) transport system substrate-binding protein